MRRSGKIGRLIADDGRTVCAHCELADTPLSRLRGLLGQAALPPGHGLLLVPSNSVHTFFMRFPIDVVLLDRNLVVRRVAHSVRRSKLVWQRGARRVLELPSGEANRLGLRAGTRLTWVDQTLELHSGRAGTSRALEALATLGHSAGPFSPRRR